MFMHGNKDGTKNVILDPGEVITVEMPGGNGNVFTISGDGTITDEDGNDVTALAYGR